MSNFEQDIPKNLKTLRRVMTNKRSEIWAIERQYLHECDCQFCGSQEYDLPPDQQEIVDNLEKDIIAIDLTITRLKRHAQINNVKIPA